MSALTPGRERMIALVNGEIPDRPPISFWRHFYDQENDAESLARALLGFHREFGWDWIKLNSRACYHIDEWGFEFRPSTDPLVKPVKTNFPIKSVDDWSKIDIKSATEGVFAEHLDAIRRIVAGAGGDPVLMTVFSPISVAGDLVENDALLVKHLHEHPDKVTAALEAITQTFEAFSDEVLNAGADGIFFATTQWASRTLLTWDEYQRFAKPYDLRILARMSQAPINMLHVCSAEAFLDELKDYPTPILNWGSADAGNPSLLEGQERLKKSVVGGIHVNDLMTLNPAEMGQKATELVVSMKGRPWGCSPDCSMDPGSNVDGLRAIKSAIEAAVK